MLNEGIDQWAREHSVTRRDALQTALQIIVLRHLSDEKAAFMGGTALVLGFGNPRFSEDLDFTQVVHPLVLESGLKKAAREAGEWMGAPARLTPPKKGGRTWRLSCALSPSETVQLHIDSQPYRAHTVASIVISFPGLPSVVCRSLTVNEIMAEKILALAGRRYLSGRDLFDLWFHWLARPGADETGSEIRALAVRKMKERRLTVGVVRELLTSRLRPSMDLTRARQEWKRYLPASFQKSDVLNQIAEGALTIPERLAL